MARTETTPSLLFNTLVLVRGAGDLGSGIAYRLVKAGFPVVMTELPHPLLVRATVSFGAAVGNRSVIIEGVVARCVPREQTQEVLEQGAIAVLVDPGKTAIEALHPAVVIDARMIKANPDTCMADAPLVIGLGPGYTAGMDCHAVIETNRGHRLGRVIWEGTAEPDTKVPAPVDGKKQERVLRSPADGIIWQFVQIGEFVQTGGLIAKIDETPLLAPFDGVLRGLVDFHTRVTTGLKIGDLDPRVQRENCFTISDKSLAIGGGTLEAILSAPQLRPLLSSSSKVGR